MFDAHEALDVMLEAQQHQKDLQDGLNSSEAGYSLGVRRRS